MVKKENNYYQKNIEFVEPGQAVEAAVPEGFQVLKNS
jgi:hypothetical protein